MTEKIRKKPIQMGHYNEFYEWITNILVANEFVKSDHPSYSWERDTKQGKIYVRIPKEPGIEYSVYCRFAEPEKAKLSYSIPDTGWYCFHFYQKWDCIHAFREFITDIPTMERYAEMTKNSRAELEAGRL